MSDASPSPRRTRLFLRLILALALLYGLLLIPEFPPAKPTPPGQPFVWNRNAFWSLLETNFLAARQLSAPDRDQRFNEALKRVHSTLDAISVTNLPPDASEFGAVETLFFEFAPIAAATPARLDSFTSAAQRLRQLVKSQSERWPAGSSAARVAIYRLLYGTRATVEEVLLQSPQPANALEVDKAYNRPATPSVEVGGVTLHSGDILISRGGAATSALIARGNDFPGNFSHIALVHVNPQTKIASVVEAHIESGVGVRPIDAYLAETKLRILLLRPRADLPALVADPLLPHRAASLAVSNALARHIPYDFAMDHADHAKQFCSEVATAAYETQGLKLWRDLSQMSSAGVTAWLSRLGVRHFETQEPSDLEYDPQLRIVAEWRDPETLFKDHIDNAVVDALLEGADRGDRLPYNLWKLPVARLAKAWSFILNIFGKVGPVPEGMSATTALRVEWLKEHHAQIAGRVLDAAQKFKTERGYTPPYWELLGLAREAKNNK